MRSIFRTRMVLLQICCGGFFLQLKKSRIYSTAHPHHCYKQLSFLFKRGRIQEADKLFDGMPERSVAAWSIAIHGYSINGDCEKSVRLFSEMRLLGLSPNSFTFVGLLVAVQRLKDLVLARAIHVLIVKYGSDSDLIPATAMLDTYAKCDNISDSFKFFEQLRDPGLVSYNAMIARLANNDMGGEAVSLFRKLRTSGFVPNSSTALGIIRATVAFGSMLACESIHGLVFKLGLNLDMWVNNSVLDMYSRSRDLLAATKLFGEMNVRDVISWTTMIGLLVSLEYANQAIDFFFQMRESGVACDAVVLINLVSAVGILNDLRRGRQVHAQVIVQGYGFDTPLLNSMIGMYSNCGLVDASRTLFYHTSRKTLVSWTVIMSGYLQNGQPRQALDIFHKVRSEEPRTDSVLLITALVASGGLAALELCNQLHCYCLKSGFSNYKLVQNSLISSYSKCGNVNHARFVFEEMGSLRDVSSWNAIIIGYGINGQGDAALSIFNEMRKLGEEIDGTTYLSVLTACSHAHLMNEGLIIFTQMVEDSKIVPSQEHYSCIVDLLSRAGSLSDASEFVEMGLNGWRSFLSGCMLHGNLELAEFAARKLFEQEPGDSGRSVLLSNVYASVGRFQDAETLRQSIHWEGLTKSPGFSLVNKIQV